MGQVRPTEKATLKRDIMEVRAELCGSLREESSSRGKL
jgi:hypothetical protein